MADAEVELAFSPYHVVEGPSWLVRELGAGVRLQWSVNYTVHLDDIMAALSNLSTEHGNASARGPQDADLGRASAPLGRE
eukprot:6062757-Amphidinium_carterae.1